MPTTRRSASGAAAAGKQSTLSFNHRVTKANTPVGKQAAKAAGIVTSSTPAKQSPLAKHVSSAVDPAAEEYEDEEVPVAEIKPEDEEADVKDVEAADEEETKVAVEVEEEKSEMEKKALKMTDRQIETYWRGVEAERIAKRVHQEELGTPEKVLRYFDVSSQYGPCIGITRLKRWQRAERLGLNPPVEVLAVLLKEEEKLNGANNTGKKSASGKGSKAASTSTEPSREGVRLQTAHIDEILNSTAVGA